MAVLLKSLCPFTGVIKQSQQNDSPANVKIQCVKQGHFQYAACFTPI